MLKRRLLILFLLLSNVAMSQDITVQLLNELTIGNDENAPAEYLFSRISSLTTDSNNNIYVSQKNISEIKIFTKNGHFIKSIGKKGQGPGEIQEVTCMVVDLNDDLIVVDRLNHRFTRFENLGEKFQIYSIPLKINIDPWAIYPLGPSNYLLYYHIRSNPKLIATKEDLVFHIYDKNFSGIKKSFGKAGEIWNFKEPFLRTQVGKGRSNLFVINQNEILFAPEMYKGAIFLYQNADSEWRYKILHGKKSSRMPYKILNRSQFTDRKYPIWTRSSSGPGYRFLVQSRNLSKGLIVFNNGVIAHFTRTLDKNEKGTTFGVELFDNKGSYLGYGTIQKNSVKDFNQNFIDEILWKDKIDRIYTRSFNRDGFQIIEVFRLEYTIR